MKTLSIDIETYSGTDIKKSGLYKYVEDPAFDVLMIAYALDDDPVEIIDGSMSGEQYRNFMRMLIDPTITKRAYNAAFERICLTKCTGIKLDIKQWECTMVRAAYAGLPFGLDVAAKAAGLQVEKDAAGKALIKYFSMPCKPTKVNGMRTRNTRETDPVKWASFLEYCKKDVIVERELSASLKGFELNAFEKAIYILDQKINDAGVPVDTVLAANAVQIEASVREDLQLQAQKLTGLENPNSTAQLKGWLSAEMDEEVLTLNKTVIPDLLSRSECANVTEVIELRMALSKTSIKKFTAILNSVCADGRVRGMFQYYGANRTGRWAGRMVQLHNLVKNSMYGLETAREVVRSGDAELMQMIYSSPMDVLSQLIRTAFIASPGNDLLATDFSAIEARVLAWLAGEKWRLDVFNTHGKIYEASAAQMFKVPLESISYTAADGNTVKGPSYGLRAKGKVSELALGYQGGVGALIQMGALKMGLLEDDLPDLVAKWRQSNPNIVRLWRRMGDAAIEAVDGTPTNVGDIKFYMRGSHLIIQLPSGRPLVYRNATLRDGPYGVQVVYLGVNQETKTWGRISTYGGKIVENVTQAIARDCLATALLRLDHAGHSIVMHVHDEAVIDAPPQTEIDAINEIMAKPIPWAVGLPLKGESFKTKFYKKDD